MPLSLEELQRQREQIQQHLDWLDSKIADLEPARAKDEPSLSSPRTMPLDAAVQEKAVGDKASAHTAKIATESTSESTTKEDNSQIPDLEAPTYKAKSQNEIRRAQFGCFIFFILVIAIFLFLLFGLPYLL